VTFMNYDKQMDALVSMGKMRVTIDPRERQSSEAYEDRLDTSAKQEQRDLVAEWFLEHHDSEDYMRVLSLPDRYWSFENQLNTRGKVTFFGIQRDWTTLERSVPWMPVFGLRSRKASYFKEDIKIGTIQGYRRGHNILVYMYAEHFLTLTNKEVRSKLNYEESQQRLYWRQKQGVTKSWRSTYRNNTAVWLDFTGYITSEVETACSHLANYVCYKHSRVPVVVSFLAARDKFHSDQDRIDSIVKSLTKGICSPPRDFHFSKVVKHQSGAPFLSIFGTLDLRTPRPHTSEPPK
jgi:hypothetical protein